MQRISCTSCGAFVGLLDVPNPESIKKMLADFKPTKMSDNIIMSAINTVLPILPPEAALFIPRAMPHYCPACVAYYNMGQTTDGGNDGSGRTGGNGAGNDGSSEGAAEESDEPGGARGGFGGYATGSST